MTQDRIPPSTQPQAQQLLLDILPGTMPSLDGFVAGANQAALEAVRGLAPGRAVYLWGGVGSGRSHLLRARAQGAGCHYLDARSPAQRLHALATDEDQALSLVAVDDVADLNPAAQAALFALFNRWRTAAGTPGAFALLTAGDRAPLTMPLREDLRTRLGWDLVYRLEQLSDEDRAQALRDRAQQRGLQLSDEVLRWILTRCDRDMERLAALVDTLDQYSLARHRPITLPLLKDLLADAPATPRNP
ncbi:Chromosomal replication initiator protein DnaA OS=Castellaniella defragrans (strain DSM / CCUG 39792 / 65Phen) OX=1437824 GN=BN940_15131 PE=4 SV=1 [Castellaniella denitrificans]|uniref:DnaA regulatory inactivator Hda n=1 Tax=Castellaniella denitrificans TaxID=56119 RepID=UPI003610111B